MGSSVSEVFTLWIFKTHSENVGSLFLQKNIHSRLFSDCVEGNSPLPFGLKWGHEMEEGQGFVLNSNFGGMISHIILYRNMISHSV